MNTDKKPYTKPVLNAQKSLSQTAAQVIAISLIPDGALE